VVIEYNEHKALAPGVWLTGPVPRRHPERNWSGRLQVESPTGWTEDTVPESQSLIFDTIKGLVVLSGCGHAGIINTIDHARNVIRAAPVHAALGGFHLLAADDDHLQWTADSLKDVGLINFMGAHCTGIEAVFRMRSQAGLTRKTCVVGAVGASFSLNKGIDPLALAR
jgi:7,8-dihydropterin-6-yl-methyl-4-(beta-D-ribofuranosyl)aminobenzene 5'-phosphate synthase